MIYGTGGVAYGGGSSNFNVFRPNVQRLLERQPELHARRLDGRRGRRIRLHQQLDDRRRISLRRPRQQISFTTVGNAAANTFFPDVYATAKFSYNASIFRALVNYKF